MEKVISNLEKKVIKYVLSGLLLFSFLVGGLEFWLEYNDEFEQADRLEKQLVETIKTQAEIAIFSNNVFIEKEVVEGLLLAETITDVKILSSDQLAKTTADHKALAPYTKQYTLYSPIDHVTEIGQLIVSQNIKTIRQQALHSSIKNVATLLLQIALAALLLSLIFKRLVNAPLIRLINALTSIQPGSDERLPVEPHHKHDEIGLLATSANKLLKTTSQKIEEEQALRKHIEEMEAYYRYIFESMQVGIVMLSLEGKLLNCNPAFRENILGEALHHKLATAQHNLLSDLFVAPSVVQDFISEAVGSDEVLSVDLELKSHTATSDTHSTRWAHCLFSIHTDSLNNQTAVKGVIYDITERYHLEQQTKFLAEIDTLTHLHNRYSSMIVLDELITHAKSKNDTVAVMLLDLDGFKEVNDTLGHAAGDEVLIEVAKRLTHCVRESDLVGRLGGDEFLVALDKCSKDQQIIDQVAEKIVATIATPIQLENGQTAQIGVSIGIACFPHQGESKEQLIEKADETMYRVKSSGKNSYLIG